MKSYKEVFETFSKLGDEDFKNVLDKVEKALEETTVIYEEGNDTGVDDSLWDAVQYRYNEISGKSFNFGSKLYADKKHFMIDVRGIEHKIQNTEQLDSFFSRILNDVEKGVLLVSPKLDGQSIMLRVAKDGEIKIAMTRGKDGYGTDITNIFSEYRFPYVEIFKEFPNKEYIDFRCEAVMTKKQLADYSVVTKYNYKDRRSAVPSLIRKLQFNNVPLSYIKFIDFIPFHYEVEGEEFDVDKVHSNIRKYFPVEVSEFFHRMELDKNLKSFMTSITTVFNKKYRENFPYLTDGMVFDLIVNGIHQRLAYKFDQYSCEVELKDIIFDFSAKTGIYTPIGIIDLNYAGKHFQRVSLANAGRILHKNFRIGQKVIFQYRSDCIPYLEVEETRERVEDGFYLLPETCFHCGEKLQLKKSCNQAEQKYSFLQCPNKLCAGKQHGYIYNFIKKVELKGIDEKTVMKLCGDKLNISTIASLFSIEVSTMVASGEFTQKQASNIYNSIHSKDKKLKDYEILGSLNIEGVGLRKSYEILKDLYLVEELVNLSESDLLNTLLGIEGVSELLAERITAGIKLRKEDILFLVANVWDSVSTKDSIEENEAIKDKVFVVTGKINTYTNRKELEELIKKKGGKISGSVSNKTNYLITNETNSNTSKYRKAIELNVPIISEEEFNNML